MLPTAAPIRRPLTNKGSRVANTNLNCIADVSAPHNQPINNCQMCYMTAKKLNMNLFLKNIKKC